MAESTLTNTFSAIPPGFFAYSSTPPNIPATIRGAVDGINRTQAARIQTWDQLRVGGTCIIGEICSAIDGASFFCADITNINPNVMFELGYAIARNKRIWLIRDDSYADSRREFDQLRVLTTIGYSPYVNSEQIITSFFTEKPHLTLDKTIFTQSIEPSLGPPDAPGTLLYLKSRHDTDASVRVTRVLQDSKLPLTVDDPRESAVQPLYWYAQKLYTAIGIVSHFASPTREGYRLHNARYALVNGLARGLDVPALMLTEQSDLLSPMDYRDAMHYYTTPLEAARETQGWLEPIALQHGPPQTHPQPRYSDVLKLARELKDFHAELGEYVAENEADRLANYFVETTAYMNVIHGTHTIFVGRKGTGKTANLLRAAEQIGGDANNLVVVIKPVGYEIQALARLFAAYKTEDQKGYVIESLWKFMLYSEIAHAVARQIESAAIWQLTEPGAEELVGLVGEETGPFAGDFSVRLERVVRTIGRVGAEAPIVEFRDGISEALHKGALGLLRSYLSRLLGNKRQVILLIDNLDKPWTSGADLQLLSEFLLGLLGAANRVGEELRNEVKQKRFAKVSSAVFLRSDIFDRITRVAREPDKLSFTRLSWEDPELLLRVIEERYTASHGVSSDPAEMWHGYFCPQVGGVPTREYLTTRILPRPRDIVFLVKAAVSFAVNRKHDRVEERDILDGERQYSQYAWDSIVVENGITTPELEGVLLEFLGSEAVITEAVVRERVLSAGIASEGVDAVVRQLVRLTFLGLEVSEGRFCYPDEPKELKKYEVLADRHARSTEGERRYEVNRAFRSYLEIEER